MPPDTVRATAVAAAAAAQCLVPTLGPLLLGTHEEVDDVKRTATVLSVVSGNRAKRQSRTA